MAFKHLKRNVTPRIGRIRLLGERITPPRMMPLLVVMLMLAGCAQTPKIYAMQPSALESIRSEISTVGVYLSPALSGNRGSAPGQRLLGRG
jgi:hypothetical protein